MSHAENPDLANSTLLISVNFLKGSAEETGVIHFLIENFRDRRAQGVTKFFASYEQNFSNCTFLLKMHMIIAGDTFLDPFYK